MEFWTKDEFATFIEAMKDRPASYAIFMTMYYTGIREGELLALTPADIDFDKDTLTINKSYQRLGGKDITRSKYWLQYSPQNAPLQTLQRLTKSLSLWEMN